MKYKFITKLYLTVEANSEDEAFDKILDWDIENPEEIEIEDRETEVDPAWRFFSGNGQTGKII